MSSSRVIQMTTWGISRNFFPKRVPDTVCTSEGDGLITKNRRDGVGIAEGVYSRNHLFHNDFARISSSLVVHL
jgi:hypothetical protein